MTPAEETTSTTPTKETPQAAPAQLEPLSSEWAAVVRGLLAYERAHEAYAPFVTWSADDHAAFLVVVTAFWRDWKRGCDALGDRLLHALDVKDRPGRAGDYWRRHARDTFAEAARAGGEAEARAAVDREQGRGAYDVQQQAQAHARTGAATATATAADEPD